jgi:pyruvate,orthophosphate dikinase
VRTSWPGSGNTGAAGELEKIDKGSYDELLRIMALLEGHYRDLCDIEFTIERGTLWMLQSPGGQAHCGGRVPIATQLVDEGLIDADEAVRRVSGGHLVQLMFPAVRHLTGGSAEGEGPGLGRGMSASPRRGGRQGRVRLLHRREVEPLGGEGHPRAPGGPTRTT